MVLASDSATAFSRALICTCASARSSIRAMVLASDSATAFSTVSEISASLGPQPTSRATRVSTINLIFIEFSLVLNCQFTEAPQEVSRLSQSPMRMICLHGRVVKKRKTGVRFAERVTFEWIPPLLNRTCWDHTYRPSTRRSLRRAFAPRPYSAVHAGPKSHSG